ncbi:MAG: hypothetical protein ABI678_14220, partial [Kofleriaceae bacterium]
PVAVKPKQVAIEQVPPAPEPAPAPPIVASPPAPAPPIAMPAPLPVAPSPVWTTATASIAGLDVRGPLPQTEVRRAIEKGLSVFQACYQRAARAANRSPRVTVRVTLSFDDSRHATGVAASLAGWPELAACVHTVAEDLRVTVAPDVGTADVVATILFTPVAP